MAALRNLPLPLLALVSTFAPIVIAVPTRTHCRCTIVDANSEPATYTPILDASRRPDICNNLGPELEYFNHAEPELYEAYINQQNAGNQASATPTKDAAQSPTTVVLMKLGIKNGLSFKGSSLPRPTERPSQRIVCHSEPEVSSVYHDSQITLYILQIIIALAVLGCIAEGITSVTDW